jgi:uncharacterized lipoprotein YajG
MKTSILRLTTSLLAILAAMILLSGCSAMHADQTGTAENQQLTKDRQAKIEAHKADK